MKIINKSRGSGKTTSLVNCAYVTGYPIIVATQAMKNSVKETAIYMNCNDIKVYTIKEWLNEGKSEFERNVLIDELPIIMNGILNEYLNANVIATTMTIEMK